ncbi:apyrase-like [Tribolium madens]|uniref:apyrase-like n=1 Tax=Tribolium madens TaxID=41895 RepID=UPI001CF764A9|nr:apyrase-like [Tribolium madens]
MHKINVFILILKIVVCANFNLTIIHFNDFHARYEPIDNLSTTCEGETCIGGFSRLYSKIIQLKNEMPNSLLLNAGDNFQGTLWYIVHKWNVTQHFLNKLPFDAITLGNHEFDDGIAGLVPYLNHIKAPVVVCNIDDSNEPSYQNLTRKSVIVEKDGKKIGIIGVLVSSTNLTSRTENLIFQDESESVNTEAKKLQNLGVFTIIVLSHCGYEADLEIAQKSNSKISVIVGGHTDTFLYSGTPVPGPDKPSGPYPTPVLNRNGDTVLVVQASAYTKYLGDLNVIYDEFANVTGWGGNPVFLGPQISSDAEIDADLAVWKKDVDSEGKKVVGNSKYAMRNKPCRSEECPLGNFATDAMVENYKNMTQKNAWNFATVAMIHAGGMRAGIETGNITFNQLITTFPFQDTINICEIKGEHLVKILESCVDDNHLKWPHLFQVSGLKIVFNVSNPEGGRVQSIKIRCKECIEPIYEDLVLEAYYRVLLPTFLTDTDFNPLFKKYIKNKIIGDRDSDVYVRYLENNFPLSAKVEDRIKIVSRERI